MNHVGEGESQKEKEERMEGGRRERGDLINDKSIYWEIKGQFFLSEHEIFKDSRFLPCTFSRNIKEIIEENVLTTGNGCALLFSHPFRDYLCTEHYFAGMGQKPQMGDDSEEWDGQEWLHLNFVLDYIPLFSCWE